MKYSQTKAVLIFRGAKILIGAACGQLGSAFRNKVQRGGPGREAAEVKRTSDPCVCVEGITG